MNIVRQTNWKVWHWPWHNVLVDHDYGIALYSHFAGFGPFQFHWYSTSERC